MKIIYFSYYFRDLPLWRIAVFFGAIGPGRVPSYDGVYHYTSTISDIAHFLRHISYTLLGSWFYCFLSWRR